MATLELGSSVKYVPAISRSRAIGKRGVSLIGWTGAMAIGGVMWWGLLTLI